MPATPTATRKIEGPELVVGDAIVFLGRAHLIDRFEEASDLTKAISGDPAARFAFSGDWSMTIHAGQYLDVIRVP